jgi:hypothetical protein
MPSAVFDYDETRKRVRTDYPFRREATPQMSALAPAAPSTVGTSAVLSCAWRGKSAGDTASRFHNRNAGMICATT